MRCWLWSPLGTEDAITALQEMFRATLADAGRGSGDKDDAVWCLVCDHRFSGNGQRRLQVQRRNVDAIHDRILPQAGLNA
jgi:hypothetical protein